MPFIYKRGKGASEDAGNHTRKRCGEILWKRGSGDQSGGSCQFCRAAGEFIGVMGASGSGKTTLLNLLSTIDRVTAGHIYYGDTDITELGEEQLSEFRKNSLGLSFRNTICWIRSRWKKISCSL